MYRSVEAAPVGVEEDEAVASDQVNAATARFAAEKEHELALCGVVECHHQLLALALSQRTIQARKGVAPRAAELLK